MIGTHPDSPARLQVDAHSSSIAPSQKLVEMQETGEQASGSKQLEAPTTAASAALYLLGGAAVLSLLSGLALVFRRAQRRRRAEMISEQLQKVPCNLG